MSYEYELAMGTDKNGAAANGEAAAIPAPGWETEVVQQNGNGGSALVAGGVLAGVAALVLGFLAFSIALPFGIGAAGGALAAPKGHKKEAAKKAAIYGGLAGIGSGIVLNIVSGATGRYVGGSGLIPFAVGLYVGYQKREEAS